VVLVEGESEEAFIRAIQLRSTVLNFDFGVYVYGGKGTLKNLVHYILEKNRQGIRVNLCLDFDGQSQSTSFLENLNSNPARYKPFLVSNAISRRPFPRRFCMPHWQNIFVVSRIRTRKSYLKPTCARSRLTKNPSCRVWKKDWM
jgi:hypothetical protein